MKTVLILTLFLTGCATTNQDYARYVEAQKSISRDLTVAEAARINALIELSKSSNPTVRATAIMQLQQLPQTSKQIHIEPPRSLFSF
jgi:PBP1b-binding outer membrane lipoprotein LpoB